MIEGKGQRQGRRKDNIAKNMVTQTSQDVNCFFEVFIAPDACFPGLYLLFDFNTSQSGIPMPNIKENTEIADSNIKSKARYESSQFERFQCKHQVKNLMQTETHSLELIG